MSRYGLLDGRDALKQLLIDVEGSSPGFKGCGHRGRLPGAEYSAPHRPDENSCLPRSAGPVHA